MAENHLSDRIQSTEDQQMKQERIIGKESMTSNMVNKENSLEEPSYPTSFSHIVALITSGQPIQGIQQVPNTVLSGKDKPPAISRRPKPWENNNASNTPRHVDD